jgi:hypothetical protein
MIHPRSDGTPRQGRNAAPHNDQARATPTFAWSCRRDRCSIFLRDPCRRPDHESAVGAPSPTGAGASRGREDALAGRHPGSRRPRTPADGRVGTTTDPVVTRAAVPDVGHARPRRDRPRRVSTQLSGGTEPRSQVDHRIVAALLNVTCSYAGPGGQTSTSQRAHTIGSSPTGPPNNRSALRPLAFPMVKHTRGRPDLPRPSPTDRREGEPKPRQPRQLAPTDTPSLGRQADHCVCLSVCERR